MHTVAVHLAPVLAAEKSKVPFYIAGGLLVAWALLVSLGIGLRRPDFPSNASQQKAIMGISAVLVLAAVSMAIVTSGGSTGTIAAAAGTATQTTSSGEAPPTATQPTATTGTPNPPSSPAAGGASALKLAANPEGQLSYDAKALSAKAGSVTIAFANASPLEHNMTIAQGTKVLGSTPTFLGGSKSVTLKLKPGKYTFYCSVPGHRQAGMEGTLTVS
jgi:uncharacterized cupredoxin-like copper-binding protein